MKTYNKLVRDKIPEILTEKGVDYEFRIAKKDEMMGLLCEKLREEIEELIEKPSAEEIADVLEVVEYIAKLNRIGLDEIKTIKIDKRVKRGGFNERIVLETTN